MPKKSPNNIEELLDRINDIYLALDEDWNITRLNTRAKKVFNLDIDSDPYGNLWEQLPEVANAFSHTFKKCIGQNRSISMEGYYRPGNKWFAAHTTPSANGGIDVFFRDITEHHQTEATLRNKNTFLTALINRMPQGVMTVDSKSIIHTFNLAAETLFEYDSSEIIGQNVTTLMSDTESKTHDDFCIMDQDRVVLGRKKSGETFSAEISTNETLINDQHYFVIGIRDISNRQQEVDELYQHRKHLEQLVENRTHDLALARDRALEANKAKSTFLANMSHELRTPLNAIIGYSEIIEEETSELNHATLPLDIRKIRTAGKHLLSLINGVLDLSKIEAGCMDNFIESFHLLSITEDVISSIDSLVKQNDNKTALEANNDIGEINSDVTKVRQILFNLISNANKFTKDGTITVKLSRSRFNDADWVTIQVSDTGIGMNHDQMEHLFEPFMQGDRSTTRKYGGTGLGLAITHRLCELLGGSINVSSIPEQGSIFSVRLPAIVQTPTENQPRWFSVGPKVNPKVIRFGDNGELIDQRRKKVSTVLVIDDDANIRDLMERFLSRQGFFAYTAKSAEEGLLLAREVKPDIITLDVMMPEKDGWWVLSQLKNDPDLSHIPTIMMTLVEDKELGYALGAADYLTKPVNKEKLLETINKFVRTKDALTAYVIQPDDDSGNTIQAMLESKNIGVLRFTECETATQKLKQSIQPDFIVIELVTPTGDSVQFMDKLKKHPSWKDISIFATTAGELSETETCYLKQNITNMLQSDDCSGEEFLNDLKTQLVNCVRQKP